MALPIALTKAKYEVEYLRRLLVDARANYKITLREFAELSGVSAATLSRYENKREITATHYWAIFNALLARVKTETRRRAAKESAARRKRIKERAERRDRRDTIMLAEIEGE